MEGSPRLLSRATGDTQPWQRTAPRAITVADRRRFTAQLRDMLLALGLPADQPGTAETPERLLDALIEATEGYEGDPHALTTFPAEHIAADRAVDQIVEGPVKFQALCEHHALPFLGDAWVGYVPGPTIIGISKLTRIVRLFARRFTVQERLGVEIGEALAEVVDSPGCAVLIRASHTCTQLRGVRESDTATTTTTWHGVYLDDHALRAEFLSLVGGQPRS